MAPVASTTAIVSNMATSSSPVSSMSSTTVDIYVVNPNSSSIITDALSASLSPQTPPGCTSHFITGPPSSPESIQDVPGSIISAAETYRSLLASSPSSDLTLHPASAFLVACFSDHPLVGILRQKCPNKPSIHLLEAAIIHALTCGTRFGVLTTGKSVVPDVEAGVRKVMGGNSDRYVGTHATGLGVVELQSGNRDKVEGLMKKGAQELVGKGADVIILGCAGMTGMEGLVRRACAEVGEQEVAVIDGAKAGMQILAGLARVNYRS
ncbi:related to DCG1 - involved in nitrogen-catabolite metabolism [Ustilago trichophora]|uniref:Related to DCG1 - involved in nitrogen-catabolite metabolism n=1 Tax=Ustilago trichophora TaxID=86804 RepID=A0A5C3E881_9BASI|nr:related to DCG1 - involved in nitrogen-catabolite metabolism [Ustilago trichophora]